MYGPWSCCLFISASSSSVVMASQSLLSVEVRKSVGSGLKARWQQEQAGVLVVVVDELMELVVVVVVVGVGVR